MTRAQLQWRCRRGTRELDLVLQRYLEERYDQAAPGERLSFQRLLERSDDEIWHWLCLRKDADDPSLAEIIRQLRALSPTAT